MTGKHKQIEGYEKTYWSKAVLDQVEQIEYKYNGDRYIRDQYLEKYKKNRQELLKINREIVLLSRTETRFKTLDQLCSFVGIVPDTSSSDTTEHMKGMTKRANVELRRLLIQSSWMATNRCTYMASIYQKHKIKRQQKGIIKVARKILSIVRALWLKKENYNIEKMYIV